MDRRLARRLSVPFTIVLIIAGLYAVQRYGRELVRQIADASWSISPLPAVLSSVLLLLALLAVPAGWRIICRSLGCTSDNRELNGVWFISQLGRYIPGKIWMYAGRAGYLRGRGLPVLQSSLAPLFEMVHIAASAGLVTVTAAFFMPPLALPGPVRTGLLCAGACVLVLPLLHPFQKVLFRLRHGSEGDGELAFLTVSASAGILALYSVIWIVRGLALWLWLSSFGVSGRGLLACLAAAPISWLAGYIVFLVPGGIGVREVAATAIIAMPGEAGPVLVALAAQRIVIALIELALAALYAGHGIMSGRKQE